MPLTIRKCDTLVKDPSTGSMVPVDMFLAGGYVTATGDQTDMSSIIQKSLRETGVCRLGPGHFYVSGIDVPDQGQLIGSGNSTRIILLDSVTSGYAVKLRTRSTVKNLMIMGVSGYSPVENVGTRHGILFEGTADAEQGATIYSRATVDGIFITGFHGGGITCHNTGGSVGSTLLVSNVYIQRCDAGINIDYYSEYHRFTNVSANSCYYGCICNGGNNNFANCSFSGNTIGLLMDDSDGLSRNNSHGTFDACSFNHSGGNTGIAIKLVGLDSGEIFIGAQIFFGRVIIDNCLGIRFIGANFGSQTPITVTDSRIVVFSDCVMRQNDEDQTDSELTESGNTALVFTGCYNRKGKTLEYNPLA